MKCAALLQKEQEAQRALLAQAEAEHADAAAKLEAAPESPREHGRRGQADTSALYSLADGTTSIYR